tara:strand:- start:1300 stop:2052 length:753 start_codon:yes stop_codon:yes gene_type:complete
MIESVSNLKTLTNFNEFKSYVCKYGYSMANLYDIQFDVPNGTGLYLEFIEALSGATSDSDAANLSEIQQLMRLYTTECTMPGVTMSDSEYRITNTPQLKYAYGAVFNEFSVTFTMDANSNIRKLFDKWTNIIYPYSQFRGVGDGVLRTRYKDDYIADITVTKFERGASSPRNRSKSNRIGGRRIIPDGETKRDSLFVDNVAVHAVRMKNAFPKSIDSMTLSGDAGQLTQFSVSFEYESLQTSTPTRSPFG